MQQAIVKVALEVQENKVTIKIINNKENDYVSRIESKNKGADL